MSSSSTPSDGTLDQTNLIYATSDLSQGSVGAILSSMLRAARLHLGMEVAFISQFVGDQREFRYVDQGRGTDLIAAGDDGALDESYCLRVVDGRLPELIHNAQQLPEACALAVTSEIGVGAHVSTPIRLSDGSVFGTFCCFSLRPNDALDARDLNLIRIFAQIAGELVERDVTAARLDEQKRERINALLASDGFGMVWQPILDMASGKIAGVEALARFPANLHRSPDEWFQEAASVGLSNALETRAIEKALAVLEHIPEGCYVACNAGVAALTTEQGMDVFDGLPLQRIVLEITEHDVINDYSALRKVLAPLREKGLRIAVDDAGAGYASFLHILQLKPDIIKLDMSITRDIDKDIPRRSLAHAMVQFSREIGSKLVAEGVETQEEFDALAELGVELVQGYFCHRPKPLNELVRLF